MTNTNTNSVLREVDNQARRQVKTLIRSARFASLSCLASETGAPLISQVNVATDLDGSTVFLISSLSPHFAAIEADSRCALLFGVPGKGDPAAYPRVSLMGDAQKIQKPENIERIRRRFLARHPKSSLYVDFTDFSFWRVRPTRASFNGGFGKAYEMAPSDISTSPENCPGLEQLESEAIDHMNSDHSDAVALYATQLLRQKPGAWKLVTLDSEGLDLALDSTLVRLWFEAPLCAAEELRPRLIQLTQSAKMQSSD